MSDRPLVDNLSSQGDAKERRGRLLAEALACHRRGELPQARQSYLHILDADGKDAEVLTLLGTVHAQEGDFEGAAKLIRRSLTIDRRQPFALNSLGNALNSLQRHGEALAAFDAAIKMKADHAAAYNNRGTALRGLKRSPEALASIDKAIALSPEYPEAFNNRGLVLHDLGRDEEAVAGHERAVALRPHFSDAHRTLGDRLQELKRYDGALASYDRALLLQPGNADLYCSRSHTLRALKRYDEAIESSDRALALCPESAPAHFAKGLVLQEAVRNEDALASYDRAVSLDPAFAAAYNNRGNVLAMLRRHKEALDSYDAGIGIDPAFAEAYANRGLVLRTLRRPLDALASYDKAVALKPDYAEAHDLRGQVLHDIRRIVDAVQAYDTALSLRPRFAGAYHHRSNALKEVQRFDEALESIEKAIEIDPDIPYALGERLMAKMHSCHWAGLQDASSAVLAAVARGSRASTPFAVLATPCTEDLRLRCADIFMRDQHPPRPDVLGPIRRSAPSAGGKIRVAYVSGDFRTHAVTSLITGVFEHHDRARFEVYAISFARDDESAARARLVKAVDHFIDVRERPDIDVTSLLRDSNIDIAVDLMGFTGNCRTGIFALRAAPIQINFLGYPGTMGAGYIDYIIADKIVIPETEQRYYAEKVVYLPDTYQCNDSKRQLEKTNLTRSTAGLPPEGFVFCSFNNNYKIGPEMFDVWMRILRQTEGSVLWLLRANPQVERNLKLEAEKRGVSGSRLVFAPRLFAASDHLARQALADLFLDTQPYGAHTTASDALWAGLPVLTLMGDGFAGRVAASLLSAIGLPDMVTRSLADYEQKAVALAHNPSDLAGIKAALERNRETYPLFDTARFTRGLERAYGSMMERYRNGEPPASFAVEGVRSRSYE